MRGLLFLLALTLVPASASALTVQEVVTLSKAGVSEPVLLAMIERDNSIFALDAEQVIALKKDGVGEKVVIAMLKSGRQEPPPAPASSDSSRIVEPLVVMVGHGPERPNTYHEIDTLGNYVYPVGESFLFTPFTPYVPFAYGPFVAAPPVRPASSCRPIRRVAGSRPVADPANCRRTR
jgi:hypothetical protein